MKIHSLYFFQLMLLFEPICESVLDGAYNNKYKCIK